MIPSLMIMISLILLAAVSIFSRIRRLKIVVVSLSAIITIIYILWRGIYTLNTQDRIGLLISLAVYLAELYGFIQYILFHYQSARPTDPVPPVIEDADLPTVDILITIYNEPKEILYRTIVGCLSQDYPEGKCKVYVLDDGRREEIRKLTTKLGCEYIARPTNENVKAGNLNNGLKHSRGDLVAAFDCDHVPVRSFLKETVVFFNDKKVAFVQTPHHFYNPDTFQRNLKLEQEIGNEQDLFFHVIQPGRNYYNSAFFAGSGGIFRRPCLEEIGGFKTETLTEDLHTSMELHSRGYKSVYVNKDLSAGLSPESFAGYLKQRKRWARGGVQIFLLDNPLLKKGLTLHQKLNYFASVIYFFHGLPRIIYLSAPLAYLIAGYPPILTDTITLLSLFIPHYIASTIAFNMTSKGHRNPFWSDVYETVMSFGLTATAIATFFSSRRNIFSVTPKGERFEKPAINISMVSLHISLLALLLTGCGLGLYSIVVTHHSPGALLISFLWASYNSLILIIAIIAAIERPQRRGLIRLAREIEVKLFLPDREISARTKDISETGLSLYLPGLMKFTNPEIRLSLISDYGEVTNLKGAIVRNDVDKSGRVFAGIEFLNLDEAGYQGIIRQMYSPANSWRNHHNINIPSKTWGSFMLLLTTPVKAFIRDKVLRRISPRFGTVLPCDIVLEQNTIRGKTIDISSSGLSLETISGNHMPPKIDVRVYLSKDMSVPVKGHIIWKKEGKNSLKIGIRFTEDSEGKTLWKELRG